MTNTTHLLFHSVSAAVDYHRAFHGAAALLSIASNLLLLYLISRHTRREMHSYRVILLSSTFADLLLSVVILFTMPCLIIDDGSIVYANLGLLTNVSQSASVYLSTLYYFAVLATYTTPTFQFLHRFNGVVRKNALSEKTMALIYVGMMVAAAAVCTFSTTCQMLDGDINGRGDELLRANGFLIDGKPPIQISAKSTNWSFVGLSGHITFSSCCYIAILYFAVRIRHTVRQAAVISEAAIKAQRQVNYIIGLQCSIPIVFVNIPTIAACLATLVRLRVHGLGELLIMGCSTVPILNALSVVLIVKSYRHAVLRSVWKLTPSTTFVRGMNSNSQKPT